jgi:BirA family biotin operon repressor/biotin-[acetyl-CoA-carboxylase] ligase
MPGSRFTDIRRLETVDSTNRYLLDQARAGAPEGIVALADHQSAGRGRLGRHWEAPPGTNILLSVLLRPDLPIGDRHLACAVVALAAADAVRQELSIVLSVKWPNDLLAPDGRKVAGVLAESDVARSGVEPAPIVVGIGLNVNWPAVDADLPSDLAGMATSLCQQLGRPVNRRPLVDGLLEALEPRAKALASPAGRREQAADLRNRCSTIGAEVQVELDGEDVFGTATDITFEGHLLVDSDGVTRTVVAGDVVHVRRRG